MRRPLLTLIIALVPTSASAHVMGRSFSDLRPAEGGAHLLVDLDPSDFDDPIRNRFDDDGSGMIETPETQRYLKTIGALLTGGYVVSRGGERCRPDLRDSRTALGAGMARFKVWFACPSDEGLWQVDFAMHRRMRRNHVHFLTARLDTGVVPTTLSAKTPSWTEPREPTAWENVGRFFLLGLEHILIGYDHLLFLFALLLISARVRELIQIVTAFTVAHSITLVGAALGAFSLPGAIVEPAIALTILYVGVENFFIEDARRRWLLTFALGLVHGFGFAGILAEAGLPTQGRVVSLLSFNVGVEVGQLAVVLAVVPALNLLRDPEPSKRARAAIVAGAIVAGAALFPWEPTAAVGVVAFAFAFVLAVPRWGYQRVVLQGGSATVVALGLTWFLLRVFG